MCSLLIPSFKKFEGNQSIPSSEVLNIFDTFEPKSINTKKYFFRKITSSSCEISQLEQKKHVSKLIHYFKHGKMDEYKDSETLEHINTNVFGLSNFNE